MLFNNRSVISQLIRRVFGFYCIIAITMTAFHVVFETHHTQQQIIQELHDQKITFGPILSKSVWDLDQEQVEDTLTGMLAIPFITGVTVEHEPFLRAEKGYTDSELTNTNPETENWFSDYLSDQIFFIEFPLELEYNGELKKAGHVTVFSDFTIVFDRVKVGLGLIIVNSMLKTFALFLLIYWATNHLLVKPIKRLTTAIETTRFDNLDRTPVDLKTHNYNELKAIETAFATMMSQLSESQKNMMSFNEELEQRVKRRTQQLEKAKEQAEKANNAKSGFMSRINHELRTPLHHILGSVAVQENHLNDKSTELDRDMVRYIKEGAAHLNMLIQDIMDVVNLDRDELEIDLCRTDVDKVINSSIAMTRRQADIHEVEIIYTPQNHFITANEGRLKQIILNLLTNAIKYNQPGGCVTVTTDLNEQSQLEIKVQDTGVGMAEEELTEIFKPLTRLPYAETNCIDGTGIGLSIVERLTKLMGGQIEVFSEPGHGSLFVLKFTMHSTSALNQHMDEIL